MNTEQYLSKLFSDAGWHEDRIFDVRGTTPSNAAHMHAIDVLSKYGGLAVGEVGPGRDLSASDISFKTEPFDFSSEFHNHWKSLKVSLYAFASAHHDHMLLLVDEQGEFYIFTDPDEQLYQIGCLKDMLAKVLLGTSYGAPLEKA